VTGLVLIHGFTGSPRSFDALARRLHARQPGLPLYAPALLGHGADADSGICCFEGEVHRIARNIRARALGGAYLCGYSLGARVALGLLTHHPYLFAGATLIGVHPGLGSAAERAARVGADERWCQLLEKRGVEAFLAAWRDQPLFASQRALPEGVADEQRRIRSAQSAAGLSRALRVLGLGQMPDYRGTLRGSRLEIRLVAGSLDTKFAALAAGNALGSPRVRLDLVPGIGHNVLIEAPAHVESLLWEALGADRTARGLA
jgi:2-succinyl-6-hydroxy-2,4-cyclohexadiene-1-carboxylate synthase